MSGPSIDPESGRPNYGFSLSDLEPGSLGPFTVLGHSLVANYDGLDGEDTSFDHDLGEVATIGGFRESWSFFPLPEPVENGSQVLTGLSYTRDSWRRVSGDGPDDAVFEDEALHRETGYLLWDAGNRMAYRVIALPRGVTLLAVAQDVDGNSTELMFVAEAGSDNPHLGGIVSNPILSDSARTVRFTSTMRIDNEGKAFTYEDEAVQVRQDQQVVHTDKNELVRI